MLRNLTEQLSAFLRRATDFLHSKYMRRTLFAFSMVSVLIGLFVFVNPVNAQGTLSDIANGMINAVSYILIEIAGIFMQITIFALKFFIEIAGYNNFIDASIVKLGWNMVRDVANMFFVVILLVIAFGTILGLEQYEWKKTLAKLIMSAFLVNFSNLICQVIIDVSQVFTITFLNAIAGAAGGNLIKMFNFDEILQIAQRGTDPSGIQIELFGGAVMTVIFSGMAMATIGAYLVVMIARMVVLWTLMILSPLAFLFAALPNTQSHSQEFWNQFTSQVIVAPVMVFFLWLAFATFGGGDIVQQDIEANHPLIADGGIRAVTESTDVNGNSLGITFSKAASWENMANFAVAIAFLWIGLERVQKLGVVGGGMVSGAMSFGKNVATIASGYALGRWMTGKAVDGAKAGVKGIGSGLYQGLAANRVEIIGNALKRQVEGWGAWRGRGPDPEMEARKEKAAGDRADWKVDTEKGEGVDASGKEIRKDKDGNWYQVDANDKNGGWKRVKKDGEEVMDFKVDPETGGYKMGPDTRNGFQKFFYNRQQDLVKSRKNLEKVKNQKKVREDLMDKRVTAKPQYLMQGFEGPQPDAFDRMEQGMLEAEQMRSAAKTEEFKALGKQIVLNSQRFKDGQFQEGGTIAEQIAAHKTNATRNEQLVQKVQSQARREYLKDKGKDVIRATMDAKLEVEAADASSKKMESIALTNAVLSSERLGDAGALAEKIAAEKADHSESVKQKNIEKREERRFLEGDHGQFEVREEAAELAATAASESAIKRLEEQGAIDAMNDVKNAGVFDPFKNKIQEDLEAAKTAEEKKRAEVELGLVVKESDDGKKVLQATEAAKLATTGFDAKQKEEEAEAKNRAASADDSGIRLAAQAQIMTKAADARTKQIETQANLALVKSAEHAAMLAAQSQSKVLEDTLSSTEKEKLNSEMQRKMQEGLRVEAEAQKVLDKAKLKAQKLREKSKNGKSKKADQIEADALSQAQEMRNSSSSWSYAAAKALESESTTGYSVTHNKLLSNVDQEVTGNPRGIQKPTTALTEAIEKSGREISEMRYEQFKSNLRTNLLAMMAKRNSVPPQEVTDADKAEMAGLLAHGQKENWIDDAIPAFMNDPKLKAAMTEAFGWKDQIFNNKKINDIMAVFAGGGDMKFAAMHTKVADIMDIATSDDMGDALKMDVDTFFNKMSEGSFSDNEKIKMKEILSRSGSSINLDEILKQKNIDEYLEKTQENEAQIQFIGNLRDKAAASSHPENGGHGRFVMLKNGKSMQVLVGQRLAHDSVMNEVKKLNVGTRASMQTHATADIDEATGFVTSVRENDMGIVRGSINSSNDYRGTNDRFDVHMIGLSSAEEIADYRDEDSAITVTGKKRDGTESERLKWLRAQGKTTITDTQRATLKDPANAEAQVTSNDVANEIFAKRIAANPSDFLITMAKAAGIPEQKALSTGETNFKMMVDGKEEHITNISQFIEFYNEGKFNFGVKGRQLSRYSPGDPKK